MNIFKSTIRDGRLRIDAPLDLPDGSEVEVIVHPLSADDELRGMTEEEQGDTPEAVERWIRELESIPAPTMTEEERAAWHQRRREDREWEFAHEAERERRIQSYFE
jgi:hypothetical protein